MKKSKERTYVSQVHAVMHEIASDMHSAGLVSKQTLREFDEKCLAPVEDISGESLRILREKEGISQAVLAIYMNVTVSSISQWERGEKKPSGAALKLLNLIKRKGVQAIT